MPVSEPWIALVTYDALPSVVPISLLVKKPTCSPTDSRNAIAPSPLWPNVSAPDHFIHWLTLYGIVFMTQIWMTQNFPPDIVIRDHLVMTQCVKQETLSNYAAGLLHFTWFWDEFAIPKAAHMPAGESLLCIFIASHGAGSVGKGAITCWLSSLELWHTINGTPWLGKPHLACTVKGATTFTPTHLIDHPDFPSQSNSFTSWDQPLILQTHLMQQSGPLQPLHSGANAGLMSFALIHLSILLDMPHALLPGRMVGCPMALNMAGSSHHPPKPNPEENGHQVWMQCLSSVH